MNRPQVPDAPTRRRVAVHVPEYWPRPDVLALAVHAHELVLADTYQYSRQSMQNRARLRTPQGWQWISVPVTGGQHGVPIHRAALAPDAEWSGKHRRSLQHHYGTAPFFVHYAPQVFDLIGRPWRWLGELTCATTEWLLEAFRIQTPVSRLSTWELPPASAEELSTTLEGASVVTSRASAARDVGVFQDVVVVDFEERPRYQNFAGFEVGMSALDLLFNYGPDATSLIVRDSSLGGASDRS